jgi:hypothetical protein
MITGDQLSRWEAALVRARQYLHGAHLPECKGGLTCTCARKDVRIEDELTPVIEELGLAYARAVREEAR